MLIFEQILGSALDLGLSAEFLKEAHDVVVDSLIEIDSRFPRGEKIDDGKYKDFIGDRQ